MKVDPGLLEINGRNESFKISVLSLCYAWPPRTVSSGSLQPKLPFRRLSPEMPLLTPLDASVRLASAKVVSSVEGGDFERSQVRRLDSPGRTPTTPRFPPPLRPPERGPQSAVRLVFERRLPKGWLRTASLQGSEPLCSYCPALLGVFHTPAYAALQHPE